MRGNFDKIIMQQLAKTEDRTPGNDSDTYNRLKLYELQMTSPPKDHKRVLMEPDKQEWDYPYTRKYEYTRPNSPDRTPREQPWEGIPRRKQRAYKR